MMSGTMLAMLDRALFSLKGLLDDPAGWNTLDVNYEPPRVERLWRDFEDGRVYLHRIYPCERALFHPHPWPSAVKVFSGCYEMAVGYYDEIHGGLTYPPPTAALLILPPGAKYEMIDPGGWHSVRPLNGPSLSMMVSGPLWNPFAPKAKHYLNPLEPETIEELLSTFRYWVGQSTLG